MSNKEDLVYVNCFYYGFYIKKNELSKYNIKHEDLVKDTERIIKQNKNINNQPKLEPKIQISDSLLQYINEKLNISNSSNSSNTLNSSTVLEQLKSCDFTIIYELLRLKSMVKIYKYFL